jgi:hypothetical protein
MEAIRLHEETDELCRFDSQYIARIALQTVGSNSSLDNKLSDLFLIVLSNSCPVK